MNLCLQGTSHTEKLMESWTEPEEGGRLIISRRIKLPLPHSPPWFLHPPLGSASASGASLSGFWNNSLVYSARTDPRQEGAG